MDEKYVQNLINLMQIKISELTSRCLQLEAKFITMNEKNVTVRGEERKESEFDKEEEKE